MLFRHFGSKQRLFDAAVLTPFTDFLGQYLTEWQLRAPGSLPALEETRRFYSELVGLFLEERDVVRSLLAVYHFDEATPALTQRFEQAMHQVISLLERRVVGEARTRRNSGFDVQAVVRVMIGMAFSLVTFPKLFAMDELSRSRLVDEMAALTIYGTEFRSHPLKDALHPPPTGAVEEQQGATGIDDAAWARIAPLLDSGGSRADPRPGPRRVDDRTVLAGVLHVLTSGARWADVRDREFGVSGVTCWRRYREWRELGVWPLIEAELREA